MSARLQAVLAAIDAANAADPTLEVGRPAALLYGERMSDELARLRPEASEHLRIAVRGQHVERWRVPRGAYPEGRAGYLAWRTDQARAHAERVSGLMADAGYAEADRARVASLLRKEGIKRNPEAQMLEDVAASSSCAGTSLISPRNMPRRMCTGSWRRRRARCRRRRAGARPPSSTCRRRWPRRWWSEAGIGPR